MIKKTLLIALVLMSISCKNRKGLDNGVLQKQIDSLKSEIVGVYKPGFYVLLYFFPPLFDILFNGFVK